MGSGNPGSTDHHRYLIYCTKMAEEIVENSRLGDKKYLGRFLTSKNIKRNRINIKK